MHAFQGEGLGKDSEGITSPIEVKLFSKGVSLDFIDKKGRTDQTGPHRRRQRRHKSEGSKAVHSRVHISPRKIRDRIGHSFSNAEDNNSDSQTVFDFLNVSLNKNKHRVNNSLIGVNNVSTTNNTSAGSSSNNNNSGGASSTERIQQPSSETSQLQLYHIQNQLNQKSQELQKAKESLKRNEKKDPTMAKHFREKINQIEAIYQVLKRKEQEIQRGLDRAKGHKKMIVF